MGKKDKSEWKPQSIQPSIVFNNLDLLPLIAQFLNAKEFLCKFRGINRKTNTILNKYLENVGIKNIFILFYGKTIFTCEDLGKFFEIFNKTALYIKVLFTHNAICIPRWIVTPRNMVRKYLFSPENLPPLDTPFLLYSFESGGSTFYATLFSDRNNEEPKGRDYIEVTYQSEKSCSSRDFSCVTVPEYKIRYFFDSTISACYKHFSNPFGFRGIEYQNMENFLVFNKVFVTKELLNQFMSFSNLNRANFFNIDQKK